MIQQKWKIQAEKSMQNLKDDTSRTTVFRRILESNLPKSEKSLRRLQQEAQAIVFAGTESVSSTLAYGTYQLLANPSKLVKLRAELKRAMPNKNHLPKWKEVKSLPYLVIAPVQE
jgi:cytochrome P450